MCRTSGAGPVLARGHAGTAEAHVIESQHSEAVVDSTERASGEPWSWSQEPQSDCARRRSGGVRPHTGSGTLTRQEHKVIQKASLHPTDISRSLEVSRTLDRAVVFISRCPGELNASRSRIRQLQIGRRSRLLCRVKYH